MDGRVRLTRGGRTERITKPHFQIRGGDSLTLIRGNAVMSVEVLSLPARRGPYAEACLCYASLTEPSTASAD